MVTMATWLPCYHKSAHSTALIRVKIQILGTLLKTGRETQRGNGGRTTDLRTSEEPYSLRSEPSNPWHTTFYTRSDETQRGNGDRPTDLRTSEEPYSLRSEIGKSLALYLLYEVDETQQRFSDLRSFDMQTKQHPKSLAHYLPEE